MRREHYAPLYRSNLDYRTVTHLKDAEHQLSLNWVDIKTDSPIANRTLGEVSIRRRTGASVVGVLREDRFHANPGAEFTIESGDKVAVIGQSAQQAAFESCASGPQCPTTSESTANGSG